MTEIAHERLTALRPRSRRRALVVVYVLSVTAVTVVGLLGAVQQAAWIGVVACAVGVLLHAATRLAVLRGDDVDEHLRSDRDAALAHAYWILAVVVFVTLLALSILSSLTALVTESERTAGVLYTLSIQAFLVAAFAPAAVLAWRRTEI